MQVSAEALGPKSGNALLDAGVDEVLVPCIDAFEDAVTTAGKVRGPVTVHAPANRIGDPEHALNLLQGQGIERILMVSGNPGHGRGSRTIYELIPFFRSHGIHVSVGAYPEDYFTTTSRAHRAKGAAILVDKQAAGAQRVITQASFSAGNMRKWLQVVRSRGVSLPIHVGVMAQVPRHVVAKVMKKTRAEIFTSPRMQVANRPNLDLFVRMLRSEIPKPERFIESVGATGEMGARDGFHIFAYGADVSALIAAARAADGPTQLAAAADSAGHR